jgi:hypothetical protein
MALHHMFGGSDVCAIMTRHERRLVEVAMDRRDAIYAELGVPPEEPEDPLDRWRRMKPSAKSHSRASASSTLRLPRWLRSIGWKIDRERYVATPVMSDGRDGPPLEMRGLFEQFYLEAR